MLVSSHGTLVLYFLPKLCPHMLANELASLGSNEKRETHVLALASEYTDSAEYSNLLELITTLRSNWEGLTAARLTKIIRRIFDRIQITSSNCTGVMELLKGLIDWAEDKKLLKIELQCKLIHVFLNARLYTECLQKVSEILPELKRYDDRFNIISVHVYESRAYYEIKNMAKAKSALTSARALAVRTACPSHLQAQMDLLNGMYLSDERAYDTAMSYFLEAVEGFIQDKMYENARIVLRYIVLNKIMGNKIDEIPRILDNKYAEQIKEDEYLHLLLDVSESCKRRDLKMYNEILHNNSELVDSDKYIYHHLQTLYNLLLDKNVLKLIEPYSHVRIQFLATKLGFPEDMIEDKLRRMILDGAIHGILDHTTQCLIVYPEKKVEQYDPIPDLISMLEGVDVE